MCMLCRKEDGVLRIMEVDQVRKMIAMPKCKDIIFKIIFELIFSFSNRVNMWFSHNITNVPSKQKENLPGLPTKVKI